MTSSPSDPWAGVRPGDPDPTQRDVTHDCPFMWCDAADLHPDQEGQPVPWQCTRAVGHRGQHIAAAVGSHVAAVHPAAVAR